MNVSAQQTELKIWTAIDNTWKRNDENRSSPLTFLPISQSPKKNSIWGYCTLGQKFSEQLGKRGGGFQTRERVCFTVLQQLRSLGPGCGRKITRCPAKNISQSSWSQRFQQRDMTSRVSDSAYLTCVALRVEVISVKTKAVCAWFSVFEGRRCGGIWGREMWQNYDGNHLDRKSMKLNTLK